MHLYLDDIAHGAVIQVTSYAGSHNFADGKKLNI
jgi:hypothetical protein